MAVCHPLTARTDDLYQIFVYPIFQTPSEAFLPAVK